jgi:maleate cis-trans isomerase
VSFASWRGTVGIIKPTYRPGSLEEFIRLLPEGIAVIPLFLGIREGTTEEFKGVLETIERKVQELAEIGVDLIHPEGAPPFMVHGLRRERELLDRWETQYGIPVITSGTTQVDAMRALGMRRIVGVTYFRGEINDLFAQYFVDAGFEVLAMEGIDVAFDQVGRLSSREVYAHAKSAFRRHERVDGLYMLGTGWRVLDILAMLEQDLEVPVVHPVPARIWSIEQRFQVRERIKGFGRLLAELPPPAEGLRSSTQPAGPRA